MDIEFFIEAAGEAMARQGRPDIFNTGQGSQHQPALHRPLDHSHNADRPHCALGGGTPAEA